VAFELLQFGDMIKSVINELLPNRLCDYLSELCVKFTDFVTKCHVLNAPDEKTMKSRLLLCEATRQIMAKCFFLLGITPLERI
jgi:arginyl-tRNA synthetase